MYPILFRIGSYIVFSYTVVLVTGIIAGLWMACRLAPIRLSGPEAVLNAGFWALLGGVIGGRLGYVGMNWAYYAEHLGKAASLREGGLLWHGALIGGGISLALWSAVRGRFKPPVPDWRDLFDVIAPGLALAGAFGWLGCLLTGSAYGAEASGYGLPVSWFTADVPDIYGVNGVRFLTQPLMLGWCLLLWIALWRSFGRLPRGMSFVLYVLLYALADFGVAFVRGDGTWRWGLWLSQWIALGEILGAAILGLTIWTRKDSRTARGPSAGT